jgi:hypothetical protein
LSEDLIKTIYRLLVVALLLIAGFTVEVSAIQMNDYMPLTKAELGKPVPVKFIGVYDHKNSVRQLPIGASGADVDTQAEEEDGIIILSGKDKTGKKWTVNYGSKAGYGGNMFTADLDKNGFRDFIMIFPTGGNGLAPSSHVLTLLFDAQGRPVPFEAEGYYDTEKKSLPELVDMNGNGKAELVFMNFDNGYWITNIYEASDGRWQRLKGQVGKRSFPMFTRFTTRPNHTAVTPAIGRNPAAPDLSNKKPVATGRMVTFKAAKEGTETEASSSDGIFFIVVDANGKQISWVSDEWYGSTTLVIDDVEGRKVIGLWANADVVKQMLQEIIKQKFTVTLYGQRFADKTSPELIWASTR